MTMYLIVPLADELGKELQRLAGKAGRIPEDLGADAIRDFVKNRAEAQHRVAEGGFLFDRRNRAR